MPTTTRLVDASCYAIEMLNDVRAWVAVSAAVSLSASLTARTADACSPACVHCDFADVFPAHDTTVPANVPRIGYFVGEAECGSASFTPQLEVTELGGALVSGTYDHDQRGAWFTPDAPLEAGIDYLIRYVDPCPGGPNWIPDGVWSRAVFRASEAQDLPTDFGSLTVDHYEFQTVHAGVGTECNELTDDVVVAVLSIELSPGLEAFLPVARFTSRWDDGAAYATSRHGTFEVGRGWSMDFTPKPDADWAAARCDPPDLWALEPHDFSITAEIEGAPQSGPSASVAIDLSCDGWVPDAGVPMDAASEVAVEADAEVEAAAPLMPPMESPRQPSSGGCAIAEDRGCPHWAMLAVVLAWLAGRRLRNRSTCSRT